MTETLVHFKQVLKYKRPKYVFLEVNSPISDARDTLKGKSMGTLLMDFDGIRNYGDKLAAISGTLDWTNIPEGMFQILRPTNIWSRWNFKENKIIKDDELRGYVGKDTFATGMGSIRKIEEECKASGLDELTD